jgi:copper transport protein
LVLGGAGAASAAVALVGHTRSFGPSWLVVASDVVHVTAAAVWFGGLVGLAIGLPALAKRERLAASTLGRFSMVAAALLAAVAVAGLLLGWRVLGSWVGLVETAYGLVLLVKTAVVVLVVAVAAWNRYALLPATLRADGYQARMRAGDRLRTTVRLEAVGLVCVLLLTGFLVNRVPSQDEGATDAERSTVSAVADDVRVVAHVAPGRVGPNTVSVQVQNLAGEPIEPYATPVVSVATGTLDLGSRPSRNIDSGTYATTVVIPSPNTWTIQVSVRTGEFDNPVLTLTVDVSA